MPILIWGGYSKVSENKNIILKIPCSRCGSPELQAVMLIQRPHIFFIPIPFLWMDEEPGLWCKRCNSKFSIEHSKFGYFIEQFYKEKINKKELYKELSNLSLE